MTHKHTFWIFGLIAVLFLASACGGEAVGNGGPILTWAVDGISMTSIAGQERGSIATMNDKGEIGAIFAVPNNTSRVIACGERAASPNRRFFTFYVGGNTGRLYVMDGGNAPKELDTTAPLTCLGMGTLHYSPDSNRLGYITFAGDVTNSKLPTGTFIQRDSASGDVQFRYDNTAAFVLSNSATAFISLFANQQGQVKEAAVFHRTGDSPQEIATLFADDNCQFRNAKIAFVSNNRLAVLMGQECTRNNTWKLYVVDINSRSATVPLSGNAGGAFFSDSAQGILVASPNGENIIYTVQDGVSIESTSLYMVNMNNLEETQPRVFNAITPRQPINRFYDYSVNVAPVLSYDGRWLAVVSRTANNDVSVNILDLNTPNNAPINISASSRGDVVSAMRFANNNQRLFYVVGGHSGDNNSLFYVDLNTGSETRVIRGHYTGDILLAPDGNSVALMEWEMTETRGQPNILHVSLINVGNGQSSRLFTGGNLTDGRVTDSRFAYLLWWR